MKSIGIARTISTHGKSPALPEELRPLHEVPCFRKRTKMKKTLIATAAAEQASG